MKIGKLIKQVSMVTVCAAMLTACSQGATTASSTQSSSTSSTVSVTATSDAKVTTLGYVDEMDKTKITSVSINADATKWQELLDNASAEAYISADITINGTTITNVGIRPKGNSSLKKVVSDDTSDRYSFKIKFDEYVKDQTWQGLDEIVLNNMDSDNSYLKEYLSYDIMSYIGVDTPLYTFANIDVNGKAWGLYLAVEVLEGSYLERTEDGEGELYKPNNDDKQSVEGAGGNKPANEGAATNPDIVTNQTQPAQKPTEGAVGTEGQPPVNTSNRGPGGGMNGAQNGVSLVYTDNEISSYSAIFDNAETKTTEEDNQRVITALENISTGTDLETYVDVDAVLKYFAAHTVVVNMDSYTSSMGHNYYLYEKDGQLSMLPWDYNLAFGGFQGGAASDVVNLAIDTPLSGVSLEDRPILGKLLEVPEYMEKYHAYLQQIVDGYFADGKFEQKVTELDQLISDSVKNDPSAFATFEEYQTAVAELKKLGALRAESIEGQLSGEIPSTTDGQKADSSKLVDASSIDLTKLGNNGFGGGKPGGNGEGFPGGMGNRGKEAGTETTTGTAK